MNLVLLILVLGAAIGVREWMSESQDRERADGAQAAEVVVESVEESAVDAVCDGEPPRYRDLTETSDEGSERPATPDGGCGG